VKKRKEVQRGEHGLMVFKRGLNSLL